MVGEFTLSIKGLGRFLIINRRGPYYVGMPVSGVSYHSPLILQNRPDRIVVRRKTAIRLTVNYFSVFFLNNRIRCSPAGVAGADIYG